MAADRITTGQLKARFELWADFKRKSGYSEEDIEGIRSIVRQDIQDGPDRLREAGSAIDDPDERRRLWYNFFGEVYICLDDICGDRPKARESFPKVTVPEAVTILMDAKTEAWCDAYIDYLEREMGKPFARKVETEWKKRRKNVKDKR